MRKKLFPSLLFAVSAILLFAPSADADVGRWTHQGPFGATVRALLIDAEEPSVLYAGTQGRGVFKSANSGRTWRAASRGLTGRDVQDLAADPGNPRILYAATSEGVFRSLDAAGRWQAVAGGLPGRPARAVAIDPSDPAVLYAGLTHDGVFKSTDGGESWSAIHDGLGFDLGYDLELRGLAVDPVHPATLYAFVSSGMFKSTDGGLSWERKGGFGMLPSTFAIDPVTPSHLYAGRCDSRTGAVDRSTDGGETWEFERPEPAMPGVCSLAIDPDAPRTLYAGTRGGKVFKSSDGGREWHLLDGRSFRSSDLLRLAIDPTDSRRLFAGTAGAGVFHSSDGGGKWRARSVGLDGVAVSKVVVDPTDTNVIFVATRGAGILKSADRGRTWAPASKGPADAVVDDLVIDPRQPSFLYAVADTFYRSQDGGAHWKRDEIRPSANSLTLLADPLDPTILYSVTTENRIFRSTDRGHAWIAVHGELRRGWWHRRLPVLAAGPDGTLYRTIQKGVSRSTDRGRTWQWDGNDVADRQVLHVATDPTVPGVVYAVVRSRGVYKSTDGGSTWTVKGRAGSRVRTVVVNPLDPETLYATTEAAGVQRSTDGGDTWSALNAGLPTRSVRSVTVDPTDSSRLYAATDRGVFEMDVAP